MYYIKKNSLVAFDLDDTLYKEIDFLKSGFRKISDYINHNRSFEIYEYMLCLYKDKEDVFKHISHEYSIDKGKLLEIYRYHTPNILPIDGVINLFKRLSKNNILAIVTDGRTITQNNKIKSLGISEYLNELIISQEFGKDKLSKSSFLYLMKKYDCTEYIYIGDNTAKDFLSPNKLGWKTICLLDDGKNIHKQNFNLSKEYLPNIKITTYKEIKLKSE